MCAWVLSGVQLFGTPWIVALQAPLSMGFSRQEYWRGLSFLPPEFKGVVEFTSEAIRAWEFLCRKVLNYTFNFIYVSLFSLSVSPWVNFSNLCLSRICPFYLIHQICGNICSSYSFIIHLYLYNLSWCHFSCFRYF